MNGNSNGNNGMPATATGASPAPLPLFTERRLPLSRQGGQPYLDALIGSAHRRKTRRKQCAVR
jgi:hypothetical protein